MAEIERLEARRRPEDFHRACVVNVPCFFPVSVKTGRAKKTDWVDVFENDDTYIYIYTYVIQWNCMELEGPVSLVASKKVLFSTRNSYRNGMMIP